jgi:hypothetical protein
MSWARTAPTTARTAKDFILAKGGVVVGARRKMLG